MNRRSSARVWSAGRRAVLASTLALSSCGGTSNGTAPTAGGPATSGKPPTTEQAPSVSPVVSVDILAREPVANTAGVKHILISWSDLGEAFGGRLDPRAAKRSKADAEAEVR